MALLICPDCSGKVSEHAKACPHCGCPISYIKANLMEQANNISTEKIPMAIPHRKKCQIPPSVI